ncbi:MAG: c-type cytochrome, partial [Thermomicrobia bacterium]|nr:c-type cytochrome [Thermomicrobia bacterium]
MLSRAERQAASVVLMLIVGVLLVLVYLLTNNTGRAQSDARVREEQIARGQQLFAANCAVCHGNHGQGGVGLKLDIQTNRPTTDAQATQRTEYLTRTLTNGRPGTFMPAWALQNGGPLNEEQIGALVAMIEYGDWNQTQQVVDAYQAKVGTPPPPSLAVNTGGIGGNPALATAGPIPSGVQNPTAPASSSAAGTAPASSSVAPAGTPAAGGSAAAAPATVNADEKEYAISLSSSTVKAGTVTFNIKNSGSTPHNLGIVKNNGASKAQGLTNPSDLIKDSETIDSGKTTTLTVDLQPGTYSVVCTVPGHIQLGMILT